MRTKKLLIGTLLLGTFAACTDNDAITENGGSGAGNTTGESYVSLAINLPTQGTGSRAANDQFDDGLPQEYKVKDATLVLFEGTSETTATLSSAYNLNLNWLMEGGTTDNITTTAKIVQKVKSPSAADNNYYAFVILNIGGGLSVESPSVPSTEDAELKEAERVLLQDGVELGKTTTMKDLLEKTASGATFTQNPFIDDKGYIFMCNAPLNNVAGSTSESNPAKNNDITWLPKIDAKKIYSTRAAAEANPATTVNVERAVAKVTVSGKTTGSLTGPEADADKLSYEVVGWTLDCTNKTSYIVHNLGVSANADTQKWYNPSWLEYYSFSNNLYRFVGGAPVGSPSLYRIYWGKDTNYDKSITDFSSEFNLLGNGTFTETTQTEQPGIDKPLYCLENTFNVAHMNDNETTRAVVQVKFNNGKDFYVINGVADALDLCKETEDKAAVDVLKDKLAETFLRIPDVANYLPSVLGNNVTLTASDLTVTLDESTDKGAVKVNKVELNESVSLKDGTDLATVNAKLAESVGALNKTAEVRYYKDGMAYYPVRIKHFGDDLTPWNTGSFENPQPSIDNIYPGEDTVREQNYLGRYGVLRNNWYDLQITGIKYLGTPTIPEFTGDEDDTIEAYISVRINILSWALRPQSVEL